MKPMQEGKQRHQMEFCQREKESGNEDLVNLGVDVQAAGFTFVPLMSHPPKPTTRVPGHQLEEIGFVPAEPGEQGRASEPS